MSRYPRQPVSIVQLAVALFAGGLLFVLQIGFHAIPQSILDTSWQEVLEWGIRHGAQWGRDLAFTYGPLGFLSPGIAFDPHLYWLQISLRTCMAGACALLVVINLARMPIMASIGFLVVTCVFGVEWTTSAGWYLTYPLALMVLARISRCTVGTYALIVGLAVFEALLPLIKFSFFPLWLLWFLVGFAVLYQASARKLAIAFLGTSAGAPLIVWLLCGQHLSNLPAFVHSSWQVALYYGSAMQMAPADSMSDYTSILALLFVLMCIGAAAWTGRRSCKRILVAVLMGAALVLTYRAGTLRADNGHLIIFWSMCAWTCTLATGLLVEYTSPSSLKSAVLSIPLALTPLVLFQFSQTYPADQIHELYSGNATSDQIKSNLRDVLNLHADYAEQLKEWGQHHGVITLPKISQAVGHDSIDLLMYEQSSLLANGLNYTPRPIFQSYSAYSDYLSRLNSDFFESSRAPKWVMVDFSTFDSRYPTGDDARALVSILQIYRPVLSEDHFLLFQRTEDRAKSPDDLPALASEPVMFDTAIHVPAAPGNALFAKVKIELTFFGKLHSLLTRESPLFVNADFVDGASQPYRLNRAVAQSGFMLTPVFVDNDTYLSWIEGDTSRVVTHFRIMQSYFLGHPEFKFVGQLQLHAFELPQVHAHSMDLLASQYPGFAILPTAVSEQHKTFAVDGEKVMFLPGKSTLTFSVPVGTYTVSAHYGLMPSALTNATCLKVHSDGIGIGVGIEGQPIDASSIDYLNPFDGTSHVYKSTFSRVINVGAQQKVILSLNDGPPGSNDYCDWSWIRDVSFTRH